jgi:LacI family transcriptional regulator
MTMSGMKKKAGMADIAAAAGVSSATVSRVLNSPEMVRPELRERVQQALRTLGYVPHGVARALASKRTRSVGAIVPTLGTSIFARGVEALQNRLGEAGYGLLVANSQYDPEKELWETRTLLERGIDGLVLVGNERLSGARTLLRQYGIPVVATYVNEMADEVPAVGLDNYQGGYDLARHLIDLGHRNFAVVTSPAANNDRIRARKDGILSCLSHHGVSANQRLLFEMPYTMDSGKNAVRTLASAAADITALICTTDVIAIGAIAEAKALGLALPEDLSIAGFDDLEFASYLTPSLTTVHVPAEEIGRLAADRLIDLMNGTTVEMVTNLAASVVVRGSTGAPPKTGALADAVKAG